LVDNAFGSEKRDSTEVSKKIIKYKTINHSVSDDECLNGVSPSAGPPHNDYIISSLSWQ